MFVRDTFSVLNAMVNTIGEESYKIRELGYRASVNNWSRSVKIRKFVCYDAERIPVDRSGHYGREEIRC